MTEPAGNPATAAVDSPQFYPPDVELIFENWWYIGSVAWTGSIKHGPGFVGLMVDEDRVDIAYVPGSPCDCHQVSVGTYDPREQVVVAVRRGEETSQPMIFWGWPSPPQCYATMPAEFAGETVH